jgi:chorismate-pyruvate lyase
MDVTDRLYKLDLPTCLRICAGTDGSVTHLLELMTMWRMSMHDR